MENGKYVLVRTQSAGASEELASFSHNTHKLIWDFIAAVVVLNALNPGVGYARLDEALDALARAVRNT